MSGSSPLAPVIAWATAVWVVWDAARLAVFGMVWLLRPGSELANSLLTDLLVKALLGPLGIIVTVSHWGFEFLTAIVAIGVLGGVAWQRAR